MNKVKNYIKVDLIMDPDDIKNIKNRAKKAGMTFQNLVDLILHKFAKGKINIGV